MENLIKAIQKILLYSQLVFLETEKTNKTWAKIMKTILYLALICLILICLILFALNNNFPEGVTQLIDDFRSEISVGLVLLIVYIVAAIFFFPFLFLRQASEIHNKQEDDKRRLQRKISAISKTEPNILTPVFGVEVTPLSTVRQNPFGVKEYVSPGETVERFYIEFQNKKKPNIATEDVDDVYVVVTFFDIENKLQSFDKPRWHGHYDVFDENTWYPKINLKASGNRERLYLVIRKQNDERLYILGQESRKHPSFIAPNLELKGKLHYIRIELSAPNLDVINYWVKMENRDKEKPEFTLLKRSPSNLTGIEKNK
jgi:hypothetical protein